MAKWRRRHGASLGNTFQSVQQEVPWWASKGLEFWHTSRFFQRKKLWINELCQPTCVPEVPGNSGTQVGVAPETLPTAREECYLKKATFEPCLPKGMVQVRDRDAMLFQIEWTWLVAMSLTSVQVSP